MANQCVIFYPRDQAGAGATNFKIQRVLFLALLQLGMIKNIANNSTTVHGAKITRFGTLIDVMAASANSLDVAKSEANVLLPPNFNWTSPVSAAAGMNILVVFDDGPQNGNLAAAVSGIVKLDQQPNISDPLASNYNLS